MAGMHPGVIALLIVLFVCVDIAVVGAVMTAVLGAGWNSLADRFPARPPAAEAVMREFQSISIGRSNFGLCAHISVDDLCLHIRPARFLRFFGARGMSVPWGEMIFKRTRRVLGKNYSQVAIGKTALAGPEWCLGLAAGPP